MSGLEFSPGLTAALFAISNCIANCRCLGESPKSSFDTLSWIGDIEALSLDGDNDARSLPGASVDGLPFCGDVDALCFCGDNVDCRALPGDSVDVLGLAGDIVDTLPGGRVEDLALAFDLRSCAAVDSAAAVGPGAGGEGGERGGMGWCGDTLKY